MGETDQALAAARSAIERDAEISISHLLHAIVLTDAGRDAEAQRAAAEVLRLEPDFSVEAWAGAAAHPNGTVHPARLRPCARRGCRSE